MTATTDLRTFAGAAPDSDELLSFCRDSFVNRCFAPLAGQPDLSVGGLQGSDSVSTQHPPLKPLSDPIPLKIQFPISSDDGAAMCDVPTVRDALEKLEEVVASAPFHLSELVALGFRLN